MLANKPGTVILLLLWFPFYLMASGNGDPGRFNFTSGQSKVEIPFYTFNNQVVIPVMINDKVPLNFILDSGISQALFFDRKLAQQLGVGFGRRIQFSGVGDGSTVTAFRGRGVKLGLPGIEGHMMGMAILNSDYLDMKRFDIHGIIGYQIFVRFAVKIDYQQRILTLMEPNEYDQNGFQSLDVEIENSKPYLKTAILLENDREIPMRLMIDTGGSFGLSLMNGTHPEIKPPKMSPKVRVGSGLGGELMGYEGKAILRLSDRLRTESTAIFINPKEFSRKGEDPGKQGSIGNNLFNHYVVILDYINSKILLQPHRQSVYTRN